MGACSAAGRVGGLLAPVLIDYLAKAHPALPVSSQAIDRSDESLRRERPMNARDG